MLQEKKNYTLPIVVMFFLFAMISFALQEVVVQGEQIGRAHV